MRVFEFNRGLARLCSAAALALTALLGTPAQAAFSADVTVSLLAPGGIVGDSTPLGGSDVVSGADGLKLSPGDGSFVGGWMLPLEQIGFSGNSIRMTLATGAELGNGDWVTGYLGAGGAHARLDFSNLNIAGQQIVGLVLSDRDGFLDTGFSGLVSPTDPSSYIKLLNAHQLTVDLDTLVFKDRGTGSSNGRVDLRIDLVTVAVPELPTGSLLLAGGLLMGGLLHRRRRER
ncbi:MAG: hypothetical protein IV092_02385 [Burkholderiaceae bacterium]|nr:hypothetical protein [Burkholderiaceae bacterium]MBT9500067.1 hypothetical protein [Burkholderiaceae bacterium]